MNEKNKKCWSCSDFHAYYSKAYCCLLKENIGYCQRHCKIVEKSGSCADWYCRRTSKEKRCAIAINAIPEIYNKLAIVEQLLQEEREIERLDHDMKNVNK